MIVRSHSRTDINIRKQTNKVLKSLKRQYYLLKELRDMIILFLSSILIVFIAL